MTIAAILPGTPPVIVTGENTAEAARQRALAEAAVASVNTAVATIEAWSEDGVLVAHDGGGDGNVVFGIATGASITSALGAALFGYRAGASITTGINNVAAGSNAAALVTTGEANVAVGSAALASGVTVSNSVAVGDHALAAASGNNNTAAGYYAAGTLTTGINNAAFGFLAFGQGTSGNSNAAFGALAGYSLSGGCDQNTVVGAQALSNDGSVTVTVDRVTAVGFSAGFFSSGSGNVFLGYGAGSFVTASDTLVIDNRDRNGDLTKALVTGTFADLPANQVVQVNGRLRARDGFFEMLDGAGNGDQGNFSILVSRNPSTPTGNSNTRIGYEAGASITTALGCTFIGENAGKSNQTGDNCTAIGWDSQQFNVGGENNTSLGEDALKHVQGDATGAGSGNTGVGYTAGYSITTGRQNSVFGPTCLREITTGSYNCGYGHNAGAAMIGASSYNVLIGHNAQGGSGAVVINNTVAVGYAAGYDNAGSGNVFLGHQAGNGVAGSNKLVINNDGGGRGVALIYGAFDAAVANRELVVGGNLSLFPQAGRAPTANGEMTFELVSDTSLKIKVKGSDGVVRAATLVLA